MERVQLRPREGGERRCPYCHDALAGAPEVECAGCGTLHHQACLDELGGCTVLGCSADAVAPEPEGGTARAIFRRAVRERIRRRVRDAHLAQVPDAHPYEPYERSDFGFMHEWLVEHPELMLLIPLGLTGLAILVAALVSR